MKKATNTSSMGPEELTHFVAWLAALRSGEFEQTRGHLVHGQRYCAMGVGLCVETNRRFDFAQWPELPTWGESLSSRVILALWQIQEDEISPVVVMNDVKRLSFSAIADAMEARFDLLFPAEEAISAHAM